MHVSRDICSQIIACIETVDQIGGDDFRKVVAVLCNASKRLTHVELFSC